MQPVDVNCDVLNVFRGDPGPFEYTVQTGSETLNTGEGSRPEKLTSKAVFHNGRSLTIPFYFIFFKLNTFEKKNGLHAVRHFCYYKYSLAGAMAKSLSHF